MRCLKHTVDLLRSRALLGAALGCLVWLCAPGTSDGPGGRKLGDPTIDHEELMWRNGKCAGTNAVYLMLRGHGIKVSYLTVKKAAQVHAGGTSLQSIAAISKACGANFAACSMTKKQLLDAPLPILLHLDPQHADYDSPGRFVVVAGWYGRQAVAYDGATAIGGMVPTDELLQSWSSAVLARPEESLGTALWRMIAFLFGLVVAWCGSLFLTARRTEV